MTYDPQHHHRRSIRLRHYDYAQAGAYFVTIVCQDRAFLFGDVEQDVMHLNDAGRMVQEIWDRIPLFYPGVDIDAFCVMPNHIHGVILLVDPDDVGQPQAGQPQGVAPTQTMPVGAGPRACSPPCPAPRLSLPDVVHRFKTLTTKRYSDGVRRSGWTPYNGRLWQRNYYEHVIRSEQALRRIGDYIAANPATWALDPENPALPAADRR